MSSLRARERNLVGPTAQPWTQLYCAGDQNKGNVLDFNTFVILCYVLQNEKCPMLHLTLHGRQEGKSKGIHDALAEE